MLSDFGIVLLFLIMGFVFVALGLIAAAIVRPNHPNPVKQSTYECGEELIYRWGKRGRFVSCSGFPNCRYTENIESKEPVEVNQKCPKCGEPMLLREGRYGRFLGCSNYPKCKGIMPLTTGHRCPAEGCIGNLVERRSKKGRVFFGCDKYPQCKLTSWDPPVEGPCPDCGVDTIFEKTGEECI